MKTTKKLFALVMSVVVVIGLVGCGKKASDNTAAPSNGTVALKVWGSQDDQELLTELIEKFKKENTDKTYDISLGVVGENDAKTKYLEDPSAAADVFSFASDQLTDLVNSGALYEVTKNKDAIISANSEGSIEAATINDKLYAYPMTADNGYFLYYDSSVISEEQTKTLDGILEAANAAGKKVVMDVSNGYYIASFFLGAGLTLDVDENGNQVCDWNNEKGVAVGEAIRKFTNNDAFMTGDDNIITGGMGDNVCAAISGTWISEAIEGKLGGSYAAAKLPTFTVDGKQVQMGSFAGYKLVGVNSTTSNPVEAMALAEFLTNEQSQVKRLEVRAMGPSNLNAAASDAVKSNVALSALAQQNLFASSQKNVLGTFWTPAEALGTELEDKSNTTPIKELLDSMVSQITTAK